MTQTLTTTTATPQRIDAKHYQMESQSKERAGKVYDLFFNEETHRWNCNCKDARMGNLENCKHVRRLRAFIQAQMNSDKIQQEATAIDQHDSLLAEQLQGMQLAMAQQAEMIVALQARLDALEQGTIDPQDEADRAAWEAFELDIVAGRAQQAERIAKILEGRVDALSSKVHALQVETRQGFGLVVAKRETPRARRTGGALNGNRAFSIERK